MTNEVTTIVQSGSYEAIAALTGAVPSTGVILPRLTINRDAEAGPMGTYCVSQKDGPKIYSKTALFRTFINAYQYNEYDPVTEKFVNRSMIIKSFNEEPLDEKGGLSCGKVHKNDIEKCSPEEQLRQRNIKCSRLMYGLVSFVDNTDVQDLPVMWKMAGSNFMAPNDALKSITKHKSQFFNHYLELAAPVRKKKGTTTYFEVPVSPNLKETIEFTDQDMEYFSLFQDTIDRENNYILSKWREVKKSLVKATDKDLLASLELNDSVEDI